MAEMVNNIHERLTSACAGIVMRYQQGKITASEYEGMRSIYPTLPPVENLSKPDISEDGSAE